MSLNSGGSQQSWSRQARWPTPRMGLFNIPGRLRRVPGCRRTSTPTHEIPASRQSACPTACFSVCGRNFTDDGSLPMMQRYLAVPVADPDSPHVLVGSRFAWARATRFFAIQDPSWKSAFSSDALPPQWLSLAFISSCRRPDWSANGASANARETTGALTTHRLRPAVAELGD